MHAASSSHNLTSEMSILGAMMRYPELDEVRDNFMSIRPDDWGHHTHAILATLLREMWDKQIPIDETTITPHGEQAGIIPSRLQPYAIVECWMAACAAPSAEWHADKIRRGGAARRLEHLTLRISQRLDSTTGSEPIIEDGHAHLAAIRELCDEFEETLTDNTSKVGLTMREVLDLETSHQWAIPGLLAHMDRVILTASEGAGKSTLLTAIATAALGNLHPFTALPLTRDYGLTTPPRVLVLDFENSALQLQARCKMILPMVNRCRANHGMPPVDLDTADHVMFCNRPEGVDLAGADRHRDYEWIEAKIRMFAPDILVLGPLYRMNTADSSNEEAARKVTVAIDKLRAKYQFALLTEAHSPKATGADGRRNLAPIGTSLWLRWPEFGLGMARAADDPNQGSPEYVDVVRWRGERESRLWPRALQRSHKLPWTPRDEWYYDAERRFRETGELPL